MEQKRTLWIVAAAGVFLLVVVGAALLLSANPEEPVNTYYNPVDGFNISKGQTSVSPSAQSALTSDSTNGGVAPVQLYTENTTAAQNSDPAVPGTVSENSSSLTPDFTSSPVKVENVTVITDNALVYGTGTTTTIDLNSLKSNPAAAATVTPQNNYTASQMNSQPAQTQYSQASENYYTPAPKAAVSVPKKEAPVKETKPAKSSSKTQAKTSSKASAKTAAKAAPKAPAKPDTFWIQVGSYEAKKSADEARSILESHKITNEVFTYKDSKGKLFYRVRVGPYTTKSEAEYWQKRIASTDEFAKTNSYIVKN